MLDLILNAVITTREVLGGKIDKVSSELGILRYNHQRQADKIEINTDAFSEDRPLVSMLQS